MKKAFTMIELIFVIVILGILAAVAIPKLAATRDDAEISKACSNAATVIADIGAYYTSQAKFTNEMKDMTNVALDGGKLMAKGNIEVFTFATTNDGNLTVTLGSDPFAQLVDESCPNIISQSPYGFSGERVKFNK